MIHLYWGNGKGKTTAAMGLALRALAVGQTVAVVQFLKNAPSGEVALLEQLGAKFFRGKPTAKFVSGMDEAERVAARRMQDDNLRAALCEGADLLILDEACAAWRLDMVDKNLLRAAVENAPGDREIVLTGRDPADWMREAADYDTEMRCHRHPYQKGVKARKGVEF